jgi:2-iminobutanoate/2-iminopropanoate deaminase
VALDIFRRLDMDSARYSCYNTFLKEAFGPCGHQGNKFMQRTQVSTTKAPAAIGPYSQAIRCGQVLYTSGQIGFDPATGELVGSDVQTQAERAIENVQAVLTAAGASLAHVVKTTVFLTSMSDFQAMNEVYARYFSGSDRLAPARSTVAVAELPRQALFEIECVAILDE